MTHVDIVDRADFREKMLAHLNLVPNKTVMVTIDMHRGHLDMDIATMPAKQDDAERVIKNASEVLDFARDMGVAIIHVILVYRRIPGLGSEGMVNPFWTALHEIKDEENRLTPGRKSTVREHNIMGEPTTEIIPDLYRDTDYVINNKKRLDCFMGTDLDGLLTTLGAQNVCLMGINTNTCVLNTAFSAMNRDYRTIVMSDCVASMYGDDLHAFGLQNVFRCIGWVTDNETFKTKLEQGRKQNN